MSKKKCDKCGNWIVDRGDTYYIDDALCECSGAAPCSRMGYYKDSKTDEWKENGTGFGWCKECGAKIRRCKCSENA